MLYEYKGIEITLSQVIAACALALTIWQASLTRKHNRLTVKPVLDWWLDSSETHLHFWIDNKGLGTAKIDDFIMHIDGKPLTFERLKTAFSKLPFDFTYKPYITHIEPGDSAISKDERKYLVKLDFDNPVNIDRIEKYLESIISIKINYSSLYGEKQRLNFPKQQHWLISAVSWVFIGLGQAKSILTRKPIRKIK